MMGGLVGTASFPAASSTDAGGKVDLELLLAMRALCGETLKPAQEEEQLLGFDDLGLPSADMCAGKRRVRLAKTIKNNATLLKREKRRAIARIFVCNCALRRVH